MSSTKNTSGGQAPANAVPANLRLYRRAGLTAILIVAAWVAQPIVVLSAATRNAGKSGSEALPAVQDLLDSRWNGPSEFLIFAATGIFTLVLVHTVDAIVPLSSGPPDIARGVSRSLGVMAGMGWLLMACLTLTLYTSIGAALAVAAPDADLQRAVIHGVHLVGGGMVQLSAVATAGWLVGLGLWGKRAGVVGRGLGATASILGVLTVFLSLAVTITGGSLLFIPALLTIGVAFLVRGRHA